MFYEVITSTILLPSTEIVIRVSVFCEYKSNFYLGIENNLCSEIFSTFISVSSSFEKIMRRNEKHDNHMHGLSYFSRFASKHNVFCKHKNFLNTENVKRNKTNKTLVLHFTI